MPTVQISNDVKDILERLVADGIVGSGTEFVEQAVRLCAADLDYDEDELIAAAEAGLADMRAGNYTTIDGPEFEQRFGLRSNVKQAKASTKCVPTLLAKTHRPSQDPTVKYRVGAGARTQIAQLLVRSAFDHGDRHAGNYQLLLETAMDDVAACPERLGRCVVTQAARNLGLRYSPFQEPGAKDQPHPQSMAQAYLHAGTGWNSGNPRGGRTFLSFRPRGARGALQCLDRSRRRECRPFRGLCVGLDHAERPVRPSARFLALGKRHPSRRAE